MSRPDLDAHPATVKSLGPVMVQLDGSDTAVDAPWGASNYTPTVGDRVAVVEYRGALFILGKEATY